MLLQSLHRAGAEDGFSRRPRLGVARRVDGVRKDFVDRFLRTQVDKLRERHCDHIKTIEVREREFEVVKNEMAEVIQPPQRVVEGAKARKVEDQPLWPLPPYMAVPYPEQRGHTAYLTFCTLPYSWGYDERAPYLDGRPLPDLSEYPEGMYPNEEGEDEEMAPVGPPIPPPP